MTSNNDLLPRMLALGALGLISLGAALCFWGKALGAEMGPAPSTSDARYLLQIPRINLMAPVIVPPKTHWREARWDLVESQMQEALLHGVVAYPHSPKPGHKGNLVIAGHSSPPEETAADSAYGDVFAKLPALHRGDAITITDDEGRDATYIVEAMTIVAPTSVDVLSQETDERRLTLITCFPVGTTTDRLIVSAQLQK